MFPSIVSNIPEIVGKYPEGTIERQYPTSNPVTKPLRMAVVEREWYPIQNLRQGTPLPAFLNFGVWPGQKRPGPEIFIRFSTHPWIGFRVLQVRTSGGLC